MPEDVPFENQKPSEGHQETTRELQRQERRDLERQATRFLKRLQLPARILDEFQRLKNFLLYERRKGESCSVLAVTSAWAGEGVSFVAFHTAVSLAKGLENSVLLVDANFRNPSLHRLFNHDNRTGFSDVLSGSVDIHGAIRPSYMPYLAFLPTGSPFADPAPYFRSDKFELFIKTARARFDYVILDTPPVSHYADCLVIGPRVDHVILVVRAHRTKKQIVVHAKEQIIKHGGRIKGVVLNRRRFFIPEFIYKRL